MDEGRIVQVGAPARDLRIPGNRFVAEFIGSVNILEGRVVSCEDQLLASRATTHPARSSWIPRKPACGRHAGDRGPAPGEAPRAGTRRPATTATGSGHGARVGYLGDVSIYHVGTRQNRTVQVQVTNRARRTAGPLTWDHSVYLGWDNDAGVVLTA
jgi:putrescine transport system ATP-binding protein